MVAWFTAKCNCRYANHPMIGARHGSRTRLVCLEGRCPAARPALQLRACPDPTSKHTTSPRPRPYVRGVPVIRRSRPHAGVPDVLMASCRRRTPSARTTPPASAANNSTRSFDPITRVVTQSGGIRPSRSGFRRTSTTVQIVREHPGGGWSTGLVAIRSDPFRLSDSGVHRKRLIRPKPLRGDNEKPPANLFGLPGVP